MVLPIPRRILIAAVAIVIVITLVAVFVLPSVLTKTGLSTSVVITDTNGKQTTVYQDSVPFASVVNAAGVSMNWIAWYTSFTAASPDYKQYQILGNSSGSWGLFYGSMPTVQALLGGTTTQCRWVSVSVGPFANLNVGTKYDLNGGLTPGGPFQTLSAISIIGGYVASCPQTGASFWLKYQVTLNVQAQGTGALPYATYSQSVYTPISIVAGAITLTGSSSAVVTWIGSLGG